MPRKCRIYDAQRVIFPLTAAASLTRSRSKAHPHPYHPLGAIYPTLLPLFPSTAPYITPSPAHLAHSWKADHARQPAYRVLADWLADMRDRSAWAQVQFGFLGEELELAGQRRHALDVDRAADKRRSR